jgi:hypothetical protein
MTRPRVERVVYPAIREMSTIPKSDTPAPNFWSIDHDQRNWVEGKGFAMHKNERPYHTGTMPAGNADFYNTDQGTKMSLGHKVSTSPYRYASMRTQSAGRGNGDGPYLGNYIGTPDRVGPGSYAVGAHSMPRCHPGSSAFASGMTRTMANVRGLAEPGYSSLTTDHALWNRHANRQGKGYTFQQTQRWERPPGPGSNRPSAKDTPGPGAYLKQHSYPGKGFKGTGRGFNHNS